MTRITQGQANMLANQVATAEMSDEEFGLRLCNAAIQHYITEQAKALPELPKPDCPKSGTRQPENLYAESQLKAYGLQCRVAALEEAATSLFELDVESYGILPIRASMVISDCNMQIQKLKEGK